MFVRPFVAAELEQGLALLQAWVADSDPNVRRFAVEGTRPRGVWCAHIAALKERPELGLPLLEPVRADPSRYVQLSVANWLNDAGKSRPDWVEALCARWERESPAKETKWIVNRALRTLMKAESGKRKAERRGTKNGGQRMKEELRVMLLPFSSTQVMSYHSVTLSPYHRVTVLSKRCRNCPGVTPVVRLKARKNEVGAS